MSQSPNLALPFIDANQNQKTVTHNAALLVLDALVNAAVQSAALTGPPASPGDGQRWIVASGGTGAWAGKDLNIAAWQDGAWSFYPPTPGMLAFDVALGAVLLWSGSAWIALSGALGALSVPAIGIGTATDSGNPLAATLNNALLNARPTGSGGTGDVRVKLNKQASGNTASFLFQDGFSGRAEIGLAGDDNFHFKVSPDGATFYDGLVVTAAGGAVAAPYGLTTPQLNGGPLAGLRNRLTNGGFAVNQRGFASGATLAGGAYGLDRWKAGPGGATLSIATAVPDTTVTITAGTLVQVVEASSIEGVAFTLSWAGSATARLYQGAASGGYGASPLTVTGLAAGAAVTVEFATGTLARPQLEAGPVATPFERRPAGVELALCQRTFQRWQQPPLRGSGSGTTSAARMGMVLPVAMRAAPTVTMNGNLPALIPAVAATTVASIATSYATTTVCELDLTLSTSIGTAGQCLLIYQTGTSSLDLNAEL